MLTDLSLLRPFDATRWVIAAPNGRNLLVNEPAARLYEVLAGAGSPPAALTEFNRVFGAKLSLPAFSELVQAQFGGYQLLADEHQAPRPAYPLPQMQLRLELLPPRVAAALAAPLRPVYAARPFWASSLLLALGLLGAQLLASPARLPSAQHLWVVLPLTYLSLLLHELGHVAAACRAGITPGGIGIGLYAYLFPVLYADVTCIWLAARPQRIITNLAGIHSQLLYAAVLTGGYVLSGYAPLYYAAAGVSMIALWQFVPFVRHDGYWLLSDLTHEPNLLPNAQALVRRVGSRSGLARALQQVARTRGRVLLTRRAALLAYGLADYSLLVFFVAYSVWHNAQLVLAFPRVVATELARLLTGSTAGLSQLSQAHFVVLTLYLLLVRSGLRWLRHLRSRPGPVPAA